MANATPNSMNGPQVAWFRDLGIDDVPQVGGKNASLGELYSRLAEAGILVPNGFALTASAYRDALSNAHAWERLHTLLDKLNVKNMNDLSGAAAAARAIVYDATGSASLRDTIVAAYRQLEAEYGAGVAVAVRSSATAEDLPNASFAGQHESYLNISGPDNLVEACRQCFASLFTDRAIVYRTTNGFDHFKVALSVGVMKMIRSDEASSGVIFTLDTESGFRDVVFVTGSYGLGENIVQGKVDPDEFYVHKPTYQKGYRSVLRRALGGKQLTMGLRAGAFGATTEDRPTSPENRDRFCISDTDVLTLAGYAIDIEQHYSQRAGHPVPMDIEWAKDAVDGRLYIVQARPETVASRKSASMLETYSLTGTAPVLLSGRAVGEKIGSGSVRVITARENLEALQSGEVLVAETTSPDWEPVMQRAAAIVTERGGRTCHAAIVARELGIPAVVGAENATTALKTGMKVTVSCASGETGTILEGDVPFHVMRTDSTSLALPRTKIMVNLGNPEQAFPTAMMPNEGVGLARIEFIISKQIGIHPMAIVHPERIPPEERAQIARIARHDQSPKDFFIRTLAEGIGTIGAAFHPKPVIVRLSDFKTNEYAELLGGKSFEPVENNPMLGFRGASRYAHPAYSEGFALECGALRHVRNVMGLTNVIVMVPFCRRLEEARAVLAEMAKNGLGRGENGLEVYVMCEIPNNVIQVDAFAGVFDGFSIGSNDLTQLTLGVDRDSAIVAFDFSEDDPGMLEMLRQAIAGAHRNGRKVGICGEAPANDPDIARFLAHQGIDSISVNPSSLLRTITIVNEAERETGSSAA